MRRRSLLVALALVCGVATLLWITLRDRALPRWKQRLIAQPIMTMPENPNPRSTPEGLRRQMYLRNDLARRDSWGAEEVDEVLAMLRALPKEFVLQEGVTPSSDIESYTLMRFAMDIVRTRIGVGAPIDPDGRARLVDALLDLSHAANSHVRLSLVESLCWSGLIFEDDRVDARVKEMMNDPDPMVASNARSQYRFHTQGKDRWAEYQRRLARDRK